MSSPGNQNIKPDLQALGRSSHLRILTVNSNTVRTPREGGNGKVIRWTSPNGDECEVGFRFGEPELEPHVLNGERVEWINPPTTNQPCTIEFDEDVCPVLPFVGGKRQFTIAPGRSVFSDVIYGKIGGRYSYLVNFAAPPDDDDGGGNMGNPQIIVRG
jgi:hypothetical protein